MSRAVDYVIYGECCLFGFSLVCISLVPKGLWENYGLSDYGLDPLTLVPYALALLLCGYFLFKAAAALPKEKRSLSSVMRVMAVLILGILVTPPEPDSDLQLIHDCLAMLLFGSQFLMAAWLAGVEMRDLASGMLFGAVLVFGLVSLFAFLGMINVFLEGQLLFQLGFAELTIRYLVTQTRAASDLAEAAQPYGEQI
jgi:hypothetical protein